MNNPLIIGNLKANPESIKSCHTLLNEIENSLNKSKYKYCIAAPGSYIYNLSEYTYKCTIGAQNIGALEQGAHTGGETIQMLLSIGAKFVILGHSEVRQLGEESPIIKEKCAKATSLGVMTVLCVGEKSRDSEGEYLNEIIKDLRVCIESVSSEDLKNLVIAYEPVWAIGKNRAATIDEVLEVSIAIRRELANKYGLKAAKSTKVIYGGSVDEDNAAHYIQSAGMDGLLVGRASLEGKKFAKIINSCYEF